MRWPDGFAWGTGASSTQCEGAAPASDWWDWEQAGHAPSSADGNGFATRYAEDFRLLAALGLRHHRLSLEWARLEPERGRRDARAIAHYRAVLESALDAGIEPWLCLHHFTLPRWFAADGGFLVEHNRTDAWTRHVEFVAETFGDLAHGWQPVNEPNIWPFTAYRGMGMPPGHDDRAEWALATEAIHLATAEAAIRLKQTGAPVASIFSLSTAVAQDEDASTQRTIERVYATHWSTWLDLYRDGVLRVPGRTPVERPDLAGSFDWIGFSFYSTMGVREGRLVVHPPGAPVSPLGYGIWADGLGLVLDRLHAELPNTPLLVAEYGVGTDDDAVRAAYIERGLAITHDAIGRGVDVRGFFHWTAVDNYEWLFGYDVAFGLFDRERKPRPSARVLEREARALR
jgi:beta-glucosidase